MQHPSFPYPKGTLTLGHLPPTPPCLKSRLHAGSGHRPLIQLSPSLPVGVMTEIITLIVQSGLLSPPIPCLLLSSQPRAGGIHLWPGQGALDPKGPWVGNRSKKKNLDSNPILLGGRQTPIISFPGALLLSPREARMVWKLGPGGAPPTPAANPPPTHGSKFLHLKNPS